MRAIFEENCETGQEVKYDIFKPFLSLCMCVCMHMYALPSAGKKQLLPVHGRSLGYFKCVAAETASLWLLKNKEKNLQLMCVSLLYMTHRNGKNLLLLFFLPRLVPDTIYLHASPQLLTWRCSLLYVL